MDEQELKITILPPQKAPKQLSVRKAISSLGEHCMAFLNANNKKGFMVDETPEEPIEELMVMLFLTLLEHISKYPLLRGIKCEKIRPSKSDIAKQFEVLEAERIRKLQNHRDSMEILYVKRMKKAEDKAQKELRISATVSRKHIVGTRVNHSIRAMIASSEYPEISKVFNDKTWTDAVQSSFFNKTPLQEYEYAARRAALNRQFYDITNDHSAMGGYSNEPKSDPTGKGRINPFI